MRKPRKVARLVKKVRVKTRTMELSHIHSYSRVFHLYPDWDNKHQVELRLCRTRRHMQAEFMRLECDQIDAKTNGIVRFWRRTIGDRCIVCRPGMLIARMYLNRDDLRRRPGEIVSHECTHAGMAWARFRKANLRKMDGEEVLCYAVGVMVAQVNHIGYVDGVW